MLLFLVSGDTGCPEHPSHTTPHRSFCTIHGKGTQPCGTPSPQPSSIPGASSTPQALLQTQLNRFWFSSYTGMSKPRGAPNRLGILCVGPKSSCPAGITELLDSRTALSRGWVGTGAARRDQEDTEGGPWQLCAAPGSCTTGASLQWPFKPD